jgi:hypothetical protein
MDRENANICAGRLVEHVFAYAMVCQGFRASSVILGGVFKKEMHSQSGTTQNPEINLLFLGVRGKKKKVPKFFGNQRYTKRTVHQSFGYNRKIYPTSQNGCYSDWDSSSIR